MNTIVFHPESDPAAIQEAAAILRRGGLLGIPTETVYGLGADALNGEAAARIFAAKGRPADNPLIAHIAGESGLAGLIAGEPCACARKLMRAFWPGPMTLIFPKSPRVPREVTAGLDTVAVRMPSHPVARALIRAAQTPIAAPSANRSGRPSPTTAQDVLEDMNGRVPLILDGGACGVGLESTVVDLSAGMPRVLRPGGVTQRQIDLTGGCARVLRPGGVTQAQIASVAGACEVDRAVLAPLGEGETPRSPGMKYKHYAPRGEVTVFRGAGAAEAIMRRYDQSEDALILALEANLPLYGARRTLCLGANARDMAANLFHALREADRLGAKTILCESVEPTGVGLAVMNRLMRAAAFRVVDA